MTKLSRRRIAVALVVLGVGALAFAGVTAAKSTRTHASIQACALLPDTKSSTRYTLFDAPYLTAAFKAAGVSAQVLNAQASAQTQKSQADQCLTEGAKVILLDQLDPASGAAITNDAVSQGAKVIDYDRLVVHSKAAYYVSFDNVKVGKLQGMGLVAALKANGKYSQHPVVAQLNGALTDNNAHLFKAGYDSILNPLFAKGTFKKAKSGDQWTDWDPVKAATIFEQMLTANGNHIDAVLSANDGIAGAVVATLQHQGLGPIPLTGQDATPTGVQYILAGWQSGTVFKPVKAEAQAAAAAAIDIVKGKAVKTNGKISGTPSILLTPIWIKKSNLNILFASKQVTKAQVCVGKYKKYCK